MGLALAIIDTSTIGFARLSCCTIIIDFAAGQTDVLVTIGGVTALAIILTTLASFDSADQSTIALRGFCTGFDTDAIFTFGIGSALAAAFARRTFACNTGQAAGAACIVLAGIPCSGIGIADRVFVIIRKYRCRQGGIGHQ